MKIGINVPAIAHVVIHGPVGVGKTAILARIDQILRQEFGAITVSPVLETERNLGTPDAPAPHDKKSIRRTVWVLSESCAE